MFELLSRGAVIIYFPASAFHLAAGAAAAAVIGYLLGSINFGVILSKRRFGGDIRSHGSGNAGMTNMLRTYGKNAAAMTLLGDAAKTFIAVFIGKLLLGGAGGGLCGDYIAGLAAILGHAFPVYYKFKGGKGVVCSAVMILSTDPVVFGIVFVIFALLVAYTRFISLGSVIGMMVYPLVLSRVRGPGMHILLALAAAAVVVILHRANINRLRLGTESKVSFGKKKDDKTDALP